MAQPQAATGPTAMPLSTARRAPYFSGRVDNSIEDFLHLYEQLAISCRLTDQEKVETTIRYTAPSQRELWKSFPGYAARNWAEFRRSLEKVYTRTSSTGSYAKTKPDIVKQSSTSEEPPPGLARNSLKPKLGPLASSPISAYQAPSAPQTISQPSPRTTDSNPAPPQLARGDPSAFFRKRSRSDGCAFCSQNDHCVRECNTAEEYVRDGRATICNGRIHLPSGDPVPNDGAGRGLKASIDKWLAAHAPASSVPTTRSNPVCHAPPHGALGLEARGRTVGRFESATGSYFLQVVGVEQVKNEEPSTPQNDTPTPTPRYRWQSDAEDQRLIDELVAWILEGKLVQITPAHVLAASPSIRKKLVDRLRVRRVEIGRS